jgi:integrase
VQRAIAPLRAMLGDAVRGGLIPANPCADLRLPGPNLADREIVVLEPAQTAALIAAAPAGWPSVLLRLLAQTGLRISEAAALAWEDVDLRAARPVLDVRRAIVKGRVDAPKSRYGVRSVPLTRELADELAELRAAREVVSIGGRDLIFGDLRGRPRDYRALRRASLDPAAEAAGIEVGGFHTLRHSAATDLLRAGVPVVTVSRMLGHHSAAFTLATYGHFVASDLPDVEAIFGKARG